MTQLSYLLCISRATYATDLHSLRQDSAVDGELTEQQRGEVAIAIGLRFSALNAVTIGQQVPRWAPGGAATFAKPVRIPTSTRRHV